MSGIFNKPASDQAESIIGVNEAENLAQDGQDGEHLLTHPTHQALLKKLDEADAKVNEHWDKLVRLQADNDNLHRRAERDIANAHKYALEKFSTDLLPIVDSLELCLSTVPAEMQASASAILEGVNLTLKMFHGVMEKYGLKQVNPLGALFESEHQQAISMQYDPNVAAGTILKVLQKGYTLNNRLLRPALVIVSKTSE